MTRGQTILAGLLAVQVLLIVALRAPWAERNTPADNQPLLPALADVAPTRIEIGGDGDPAVTLVRDGDGYGVVELDGFPAARAVVDDAVETLRGLTVRRPIATNARYHAAFEVEDDAHTGRVRVWGADPDPIVDLILGSSTNYRALHVRRAGDDAVYEVAGLSSHDFADDPASWADTELVRVRRDDIVGLRLTNGAGTFALDRGDDGWRFTEPADLVGREPAASALDGLLGSLSGLRLAAPTGRLDAQTQGFTMPAAELLVRRRSGGDGEANDIDGDAPTPIVAETVIRIGGVVPGNDGRRFATRDGLGFAGEIWVSSVTPLLERTAGDLLDEETD